MLSHNTPVIKSGKKKRLFLPADKVTQLCSGTPLSFDLNGGIGGVKNGERVGRGAEGITAPHCTEPRAKPLRKLEPDCTKLEQTHLMKISFQSTLEQKSENTMKLIIRPFVCSALG